MAWVNTNAQYYSSKGFSQNKAYSMVHYKNTIGYCKSLSSFQKRLNAGRRCLHNHQCNSMLCLHGICRGKSIGSDCSTHEECDVDSACRRMWEWPYATRCMAYAVTGDRCESDYECHPTNFCSYQNTTALSKGVKTCLLKYSLDDGKSFGWQDAGFDTTAKNSLYNGQYCKSGWAYQASNSAVCFTIRNIRARESDSNLASPYSCNPSKKINTNDPLNEVNKCRYYFGSQSSAYVEDECSCAMNGGTEGYCKWPGANQTLEYIEKIKLIDSNTRCHTLYRNNMHAQYECGVGNDNETLFQEILSVYNKFYNWPISQVPSAYQCYMDVSPYSFQGIKNYTQQAITLRQKLLETMNYSIAKVQLTILSIVTFTLTQLI